MGNNFRVKKINGKTCIQTALLAELFGVTQKTLASWAKDGCPKADRGWWALQDVITWRLDGTGADENLENMSLRDQKTYWESKLKKAQTENRELENGIKRGDYIEKKVVAEELTAFFVALKQAMMLLPRKIGILASVSVDIDTAKNIEHEVREVVHDALAEWSQGKLSTMDAGESENTEAAGKADS